MDRNETSRLRAAVSATHGERLSQLEVFPEIESTNSHLLNQAAPPAGRCRVALAHHQTAGRGRLDNRWQSPAGSGLYLSIAYTFPAMPQHFSCLTLAAGIGIANALKTLGVEAVQLKWPNDLILFDGKLGGILTELRPGKTQAATVVIGVGLNIDMRDKLENVNARVGRIADLLEALDEAPDPVTLASAVIDSLIESLLLFEESGFTAFYEQWRAYDWLSEKSVKIDSPSGAVLGVVTGIDTDGALLLASNNRIERIVSGTVALRRTAEVGE